MSMVTLVDADPVAVQGMTTDKHNSRTRGNRIGLFVTQVVVTNVLVIQTHTNLEISEPVPWKEKNALDKDWVMLQPLISLFVLTVVFKAGNESLGSQHQN